jgi:hypothetical protein
MKILFHCVNKLTDAHDKDIDLADLILWPMPTCCDALMQPVDPNEWRRVSRVLGLVNASLESEGLPTLAGLLYQAAGKRV